MGYAVACKGRRLQEAGAVPHMAIAVALALACALLLAAFAPATAHAVSKAENTAYARCVKAIEDYEHQPTTIVVNVADLKLSYKQICAVFDRVHYNGRYFWVNTFGKPPKTTKTISFKCNFRDSNITKLRKNMKKRIKDALSWAPPQLEAAERVHMLHDWLIEHSDYVYDKNVAHKFSCGTLCLGKGDCLSYALGMRVLLDEAGFATEICYDHRKGVDYHAWVHVKLGNVWYNVDPTWDNAYTGRYYWPNSICHMFLLVSDRFMESENSAGTHPKFTAAHKSLKANYGKKYMNRNWEKTCRAWVKAGKTFTCGQFTYKVLKGNKVRVVKCASKSAKALTMPTQAAYRGHAYLITGIDKKAFSGSKCTKLVVRASTLTQAGLKRGLSKSKVKQVVVSRKCVNAKNYKRYKTCFKKSVCGKKVKLSYV